MDLRTYGIGAQILRDLGVARMKLLGSPRRMPSLLGYGLEVTARRRRDPLANGGALACATLSGAARRSTAATCASASSRPLQRR
jgi:hypothetical protein